MHGPEECAGNVQQLCTAKYAPDEWWDFVQCQNYQGREKIGLPEVALSCAKSTGIDWELSGTGQCAGLDGSGRGLEGVQLLQESVRSSLRFNLRCIHNCWAHETFTNM
jgi:Gamma interferon inducible lysosomal thiol reductase (GILT)